VQKSCVKIVLKLTKIVQKLRACYMFVEYKFGLDFYQVKIYKEKICFFVSKYVKYLKLSNYKFVNGQLLSH